MITIDHVSMEFSSRPVLDDITFLINRKGEVVARFEPTHDMADVEKQVEALL